MDSIFNLLSLLFLACGVYSLYAWFKMRADGQINEVLLLGKSYTESQCKDKESFMKKAMPTVLVFGTVTTLYGVIDVVHVFLLPENSVIQMISWIAMIIFMITLVGYIVYTGKLRKQYF